MIPPIQYVVILPQVTWSLYDPLNSTAGAAEVGQVSFVPTLSQSDQNMGKPKTEPK